MPTTPSAPTANHSRRLTPAIVASPPSLPPTMPPHPLATHGEHTAATYSAWHHRPAPEY